MHSAPTYREDFLRENPSASSQQVSQFLHDKAKELTLQGKFEEATRALEQIADQAKENSVRFADKLKELKQSAAASVTSGPARPAASWGRLPQGITVGKLAGCVAGIGLVAYGVSKLIERNRPEPPMAWTSRIVNEREIARTSPRGLA